MELQPRFGLLGSQTDHLRVQEAFVPGAWFRRVAIGALASLLIALCAHISVSLPFTPIPVTMQTFAVLLVGIVLGPIEGLSALILYLAEGSFGLPVFSPHGLGGLAQVLGPSGGYLLSYPLAALFSGTLFYFVRRHLPVFVASLISALVADAVIMLMGAAWLGVSLRLSLVKALEAGISPFLVGEALKVLLVAITVTTLQRSKRIS